MNDARLVFDGDSALLAEFDERIDPAVNARALACAAAVQAAGLRGVRDVVPAFRSVTVYFDPLLTDVDRLHALLGLAAAQGAGADGTAPAGREVEIPVCYDPPFGPDLDDVVQVSGLTRAAVIDAHAAVTYRVYMLGFVPGFAYLGEVDPRIAVPRRPAPRTAVPAGSVGIAGRQTGVYPRQTPGGWNIIGRTPLQMAPLTPHAPTLLRAGDSVRFRVVGRREFDAVAEAVEER